MRSLGGKGGSGRGQVSNGARVQKEPSKDIPDLRQDISWSRSIRNKNQESVVAYIFIIMPFECIVEFIRPI